MSPLEETGIRIEGKRMKRAKGSHLFGKVAMQLGLLNRDQIKECVDEQAKLADSRSMALGAIAVDRGFLSEEQAKRIAIAQAFLEARSEDRRFGQVAMENAFLTKDQLSDALSYQRKAFRESGKVDRIGEILVTFKFITPEQQAAVLKAQERLAVLENGMDGEEDPDQEASNGKEDA